MKHFKLFLLALAMTAMPQAINAQTQTNAQATAEDLDAKYAAELLKTGTEAPEIALNTIDGKQFTLKSLRGKYVVLDFWASWCSDCRRDAPNIVALYNKFHQKGVEFVGVSFDRNNESWKNGVAKLALPYTQVSDLKNMRESPISLAYHIKWIPSVYVIDPEGKVALATVMSDKVDAFLTSVYPDCDE
ncbi:peroxiredoxin family protein [Prevotella sp.]|uniref:peroxiredoxin family protein n=1 Tax=Prevotella sp. TaxID=59823 RepID=UPI0025CCBAE5|nr:TlpA disulfide reductase family protein [Prevotella sp.]